MLCRASVPFVNSCINVSTPLDIAVPVESRCGRGVVSRCYNADCWEWNLEALTYCQHKQKAPKRHETTSTYFKLVTHGIVLLYWLLIVFWVQHLLPPSLSICSLQTFTFRSGLADQSTMHPWCILSVFKSVISCGQLLSDCNHNIMLNVPKSPCCCFPC